MIKKIIGIVVALVIVAVIVLAVLNRRAYRSMLFSERESQERREDDTSGRTLLSDTLPAQDVTRVNESVPDTLDALPR